MAFDAQKLNALVTPLGNGAIRFFSYETDQDEGEVIATDFMPKAADYGVQLYDIIIVAPQSGAEEPYFLTVDAIDADGNATLVNSARFGSDTLSYRDKAAVAAIRVPAATDNILVSAYDATVNPSVGRANYRAASDADYAATPALLRLTDASGRKFVINEPTIHVAMAGAVGDGATDDTAAINAAIDYMRVMTNTTQLGRRFYVDGSGMKCRVDGSIDATLIRAYQNWGIRNLFIDAHCTGKVALDLTGSRYGHFQDIYIWGDETDIPATGIQVCRYDAGGGSYPSAGEHTFTNVAMDGYFDTAAFHNYASETNTYIHFRPWNRKSGEYCMILDGDGAIAVQSDFATVATGAQSCLEHCFIQADIRQLTSGDAIYLRRADHVEFVNSYGVSLDGVIVHAVIAAFSPSLWSFDMHAEAGPNMDAFMRLDSTQASVQLNGLKYRDNRPNCDVCLFEVSANITTITIRDLDLQIARWYNDTAPTSKVFDAPSKVSLYNARVTVPTLAGFNVVDDFAAFSGTLYAIDQTEIYARGVTHYNDASDVTATAAGALIDHYRPNADAAADQLHYLRWFGKNASGTKFQYAGIRPLISAATAGAESGLIALLGPNAGSQIAFANFGPSFNESLLPLKLPTYTVATVPSAATFVRCMIYVSDGTSNKRLAISDGTNWRWPDGAVVS